MIQDQIRKLVRKNIPIMAQIESDENLDSLRRNQEQVTEGRIKGDLSFERLFDDNGKVGDRVTGQRGAGKGKPVVVVAKKN
jgi:hypothetical protein